MKIEIVYENGTLTMGNENTSGVKVKANKKELGKKIQAYIDSL